MCAFNIRQIKNIGHFTMLQCMNCRQGFIGESLSHGEIHPILIYSSSLQTESDVNNKTRNISMQKISKSSVK